MEQSLEGKRHADQLHQLAILDLLSGRTESAAALLEEILERDPQAFRVWNDLGVTHLSRSVIDTSDGRSLPRAMDAFLRASEIRPDAIEPIFNLVLCYERLGLIGEARVALSRLLSLEHHSAWRQEAESKRQSLAGDRGAEWAAVHQRLHRVGVDKELARDATVRFPQAVRECVEDDLLGLWGNALGASQTEQAEQHLDVIRELGNQFTSTTQDRFLADVVQHLGSRSGIRARPLARAHALFSRGRGFYEAGQYERAHADFIAAERLFRSERSPFAFRNQLELATVSYQFRDIGRAQARVEKVLAGVDARYKAVAARANWIHGSTLVQSSAVEAALAAYERAFSQFASIKEQENSAAVANAVCDALRILGERGRGWLRLIDRVLPALPLTRSPRRRYVALLNASLYATADGLENAALSFQNASLDAAFARGVPNTIVEALTRRASLYVKGGDWSAARTDIRDARMRLKEISSTASAMYQEAWLDSVDGELLATTAPERSLDVLRTATDRLAQSEPAEVPRLLLAQAKAALNLKDDAAAERILREGIDTFERRWSLLGRDATRISYLDEGWDLYRALARLQAVGHQQPDRGFASLERGRGIALARLQRGVDDGQGASIEALQRMTPVGAATLYFGISEHDLLIWVVMRSEVHFSTHAINRARLARRIGAFRLLLESRRPSTETRRIGALLYDDLLRQAIDRIPAPVQTLAIVPDDLLHSVPFATLVKADTGRFLVDDFNLIVSPSAKELIASSRKLLELAQTTATGMHLLSVGSAAGSADGRLPTLAEAEVEAIAVGRRYLHKTVLTGPEATFERVQAAAPGATVLHFAGHSVANDTFPEQSFLLLAAGPTRADGKVTSADISRWPLGRLRLAVLSGCRTASGNAYRGEGIVGLVRPFLAAGVPSVVGASWDVDDHATRVLLSEFHDAYTATFDAPSALRAAQLKLKSSDDPRLREPGAWGGFVTISGFFTVAQSRATIRPRPTEAHHRILAGTPRPG